MIIERLIFERDTPKEERPGSTLLDKSKTVFRVIVEAYDPQRNEPKEAKEEKTFPSTNDEEAILSEILFALAAKIKPKKATPQ
jgi:hypothetical protein